MYKLKVLLICTNYMTFLLICTSYRTFLITCTSYMTVLLIRTSYMIVLLICTSYMIVLLICTSYMSQFMNVSHLNRISLLKVHHKLCFTYTVVSGCTCRLHTEFNSYCTLNARKYKHVGRTQLYLVRVVTAACKRFLNGMPLCTTIERNQCLNAVVCIQPTRNVHSTQRQNLKSKKLTYSKIFDKNYCLVESVSLINKCNPTPHPPYLFATLPILLSVVNSLTNLIKVGDIF